MELRTDWTSGVVGKKPGSVSWPISGLTLSVSNSKSTATPLPAAPCSPGFGTSARITQRAIGELTEATKRLEVFIRDLQAKQRRLAKVPPAKPGTDAPGVGFGSLRGRLPWPTEGRIIAAYGAQVHPRFGTRTQRNGVDIEANQGREVGAVYAGHVIYTGWFKGYGNLIILDHDNEYYTLYAHMAEIQVKEGDDVRQGQRIGTVGDTGSLEGPRLYFEVRYQGKPQDPEQWLRQRG